MSIIYTRVRRPRIIVYYNVILNTRVHVSIGVLKVVECQATRKRYSSIDSRVCATCTAGDGGWAVVDVVANVGRAAAPRVRPRLFDSCPLHTQL